MTALPPALDVHDPTHMHFLLRAVWESAVDAMALSDPNGIVLAVNPAYCELYGHLVEELVGHSFAVIFPEAQQAQAEQEYRRYFTAEVDPQGVESTVQSGDGREHRVEVRYSFIERRGQRVAMLSVIRDVTERARLQQAEQDLVWEKDNFLLSVSHDLKTPITSIKGHAQLLLRRLHANRELNTRELGEGLRYIESAATRMAEMIEGLLDASSMRRGETVPMLRSDVDLAALVREAVSGQGDAGDRDRIVIDSTRTVTGRWDRRGLRRVIDNLLSNALKFSADGEMVRVTLDEDTVGGDTYAVLQVSDTGIGIPVNEQHRVFDRFFRASNAGASTSGSGIGLAGVRQIVEMHGGTVTLESTEGTGTTFTVRLPVV